MNILKPILLGGLLLLLLSCTQEVTTAKLLSPGNLNRVDFFVSDEGRAHYRVHHGATTVIDTSSLGFEFEGQPNLLKGMKIIGTSENTVNETWEMPWGEQLAVINNYNELVVYLQEASEPKRKVNLYFRAYDDGVAFRYEFPEQPTMKEALILEERSQFNMTDDHQVWWQPGDWDIYEHLYVSSKFSEIQAKDYADHPNLAATYIPENAVNTPVTMKTREGLYLSFHEASLVDYSGMTLKVDPMANTMVSHLVGSENTNYKVKRSLPFKTPWRTIQIAEKAGDLIESNLIVNLNEPNVLEDISWFKPMKYTGIWWEMHLDKSTWDYGMVQNASGTWVDVGKAHGKHGATTENTKAYMDFSAKNGIGGVLVEGWNTGWERWIGFDDREGVFDFVTPYPDYDLEEVVRYGQKKGVELIMHHETSAATETYTQQQDSAFAMMKRLGIHSVKTGYVGKILPKGEYHHGQYMVNHYNNTVAKAANYQVAINAHEPIKATGLRRTYPNTISREGLRGQEFNAWATDGGNPPEHLPIVAFTRMLAGPIDFTPGIFNIKFDDYKANNQVNTTLAQQLALYVVIYSPVQMAADLIEHYEGHPAFQFIRDVGVDWQKSVVINGEIGDYVTMARQERETDNWFVGGITDENGRTMKISFDFLDPGTRYRAIIYEDGEDAHWNDNPTAYRIRNDGVTHDSVLDMRLAPGGGFAIQLVPLP